MQVLIIEDYADAAQAIQELLGLCGCDSRLAEDFIEALKILRHWTPDAILIDLDDPAGRRYDAVLRIRSVGRFKGKIHALSSEERDIDPHNSLGMGKHLTKPASLESLQELFGCQL